MVLITTQFLETTCYFMNVYYLKLMKDALYRTHGCIAFPYQALGQSTPLCKCLSGQVETGKDTDRLDGTLYCVISGFKSRNKIVK